MMLPTDPIPVSVAALGGESAARHRHRIVKGVDYLIATPAVAALNPGAATQRQIDIEITGCSVVLPRDHATWHQHRRSHSHVINVLFVLPPAWIEVESGGISDITSSVVRNDGDVIAYLVLIRITYRTD